MSFDRIGFIGAGKMAQALVSGLLANKIVRGDQIMASDPNPATIHSFCRSYKGAVAASDNLQVVDKCDLVILAVKPQMCQDALEGLAEAVTANQLWISVIAGISIESLSKTLGTSRIMRVMPNTPCLIGEGASVYCSGPNVQESDLENTRKILNGIGKSYSVREELIDAVTGLSGSGPAYVFTFIESLIDGGVLQGLPLDISTSLAVQTVLGAAKLVQESEKSPAELRAMVTSPGGTTIAGLKAIEDGAFRSTVMNAVKAATERSKELGAGS